MDEFKFERRHVPAFGSWDCNYDLPFTQCFESAANQTALLRYSFSQDRDLYVAGDLYRNDVVTPAMIVVPRQPARRAGYSRKKQGKKDDDDQWVVCDCGCELKAPATPVEARRPPPKAVDEDLYKISPDLLRSQAKRKKAWSFFLSCIPTCHY